MTQLLGGLSGGELLTPDGSRRYFRIVLEPSGLGSWSDGEFLSAAREAHNRMADSLLAIPVHPFPGVLGQSAVALDIVTHPQARGKTVAALVEALERLNSSTRLRSLERITQGAASPNNTAGRTAVETRVQEQQKKEGLIAETRQAVTGGLASLRNYAFVILLVGVAIYAFFKGGGAREWR